MATASYSHLLLLLCPLQTFAPFPQQVVGKCQNERLGDGPRSGPQQQWCSLYLSQHLYERARQMLRCEEDDKCKRLLQELSLYAVYLQEAAAH